MKVAIIGATGFIGRHLCDTCIGRGDKVSVLVRDPEAGDGFSHRGVSVTVGDLMDEDALIRVCTGADVVFNATGALGKWGLPADELERVNMQGAGLVVRCAAKAGAGRVVHTSTAGVTGPLPVGICALEDYLPAPATDYQRTKLAGEREVLAAHAETRMPTVIIRPTFVYGPGDTHKLPLFRTVASGRMLLVNGGASYLHPVFVDDVVEGMLQASERALGFGEVYILAGSSPVTTRKLGETIAWALGVPAPRLNLPGGILFPLAKVMEITGKLVRKESPLTRSRLKLFTENYVYSSEKARREIGFKPLVNLPEGIKRTAEWYIAHGLVRLEKPRR